MSDLSGQVALVTGAGRGIGRECAMALASAGVAVVATDIATQVDGLAYDTATSDDLDRTVEVICAQGGTAVASIVDVRDHGTVTDAVRRAERVYGRLDIAIANAGVASWPATTWQATPDEWQTMLDTVLTGTWNTFRAAIPAILRGNRGGSLVGIGSTAAVKPLPTIGHYAAAKSGVVGLVKSLALELAGNSVRANVVHPGGTKTHMTQNPAAEHWQSSTPGVAGALRLPLPIERMESTDVANAVRWLCSAEARYITGTEMVIDAGATLL